MSDESGASTQASREDGVTDPKLAIHVSEGTIIIERTNSEEHQILNRIVGILDVITERMDSNQHAQSKGFVITDSNEVGHAQTQKEHHLVGRKGHYLDWMHVINVAFVAYIAFVAIVPAVLSTFFGAAVYAATSDSPGASIHRGDLMVAKIMPVSKMRIDDVLLLRNEFTWNLDVRQVRAISTSSNGDLTTITTESSADAASSDSYTLKSTTSVHKIRSFIPKIGDSSIILTSIYMKIGGGLFLLLLNIHVHFYRVRQRRAQGNH